VALAIIVALTFLDMSNFSALGLAYFAAGALVMGLAVAVLLGVSPTKIAAQSSIVIPFAGGVALFAPLAHITSWSVASVGAAYISGWPVIFDILLKSFSAAYLMAAVMESMGIEDFIHALSRLKVPGIFIMLFTFLYRFTDLFREQIRIMRNAARSRAPHLHGWRLLAFYGRMSGNLFVRAYERGEQIHNAMLSRGYDGTLPRA